MNKADLELFNMLYEAHWKTLHNMALHVLHDKSLAEELTQNVFETCICKFSEVREHEAPELWLKKVMKNKIGGEIKKLHVRGEHTSTYSEPVAETVGKLDDILPVSLPEADRQLLVWMYELELTSEEIAERLGISDNACRARLFRARVRCKNLLKEIYKSL